MTTPPPAGPTRAARQRLSEEERRAQILRATIQVVARHGFEAASASLIAEQAGVSKGLIWHYFANKTDLMKQAVVQTVRTIRDEAEGAFWHFDTRVMAVTYQAAIDAMLSYLDTHPEAGVDRYANALADILLAAMARQHGDATGGSCLRSG